MKYLLVYKETSGVNHRFKKEWEVIDTSNDGDMSCIKVRLGAGLLESNNMRLIDGLYVGIIPEITKTGWFSGYVTKMPFSLRKLSRTADLCPPAQLPSNFHDLSQYEVMYKGISQDAVIVNDEELAELKRYKHVM